MAGATGVEFLVGQSLAKLGNGLRVLLAVWHPDPTTVSLGRGVRVLSSGRLWYGTNGKSLSVQIRFLPVAQLPDTLTRSDAWREATHTSVTVSFDIQNYFLGNCGASGVQNWFWASRSRHATEAVLEVFRGSNSSLIHCSDNASDDNSKWLRETGFSESPPTRHWGYPEKDHLIASYALGINPNEIGDWNWRLCLM